MGTKGSKLETQAQHGKLESQTNILDLHEDIFREIFRHLDAGTVYFKIRRLCHKMKVYVDQYIQLAGIFMLVTARKRFPDEILYVFQSFRRLHATQD